MVTVVGLLSYGIRREGIGEVRLLYVDPEHHARGVATMLWNDALRAMLGAGTNQVVVWVLGRNQPARVWYEHRGLTQFAESLVRLGDQAASVCATATLVVGVSDQSGSGFSQDMANSPLNICSIGPGPQMSS